MSGDFGWEGTGVFYFSSSNFKSTCDLSLVPVGVIPIR